MSKRLRILWNSNAPYSTSGYGQQTAELIPLMVNEGYAVATVNFFGLAGGKIRTTDLPDVIQYPVINHAYGSDAMVYHGRDFQADVVFSLEDQWVLHPQDLQQVNRWIALTPVDHEPMPKPILNNIRLAYRVISYSRFGEKMMRDNGIYSTYIPHTVNTDIFKPLDKIERKKQSGLPTDCFLVGMVAANKDFFSRKAFQECLDAFKMFLEKEPKALLYIHTNPQFPNGFPIDAYADSLGIRNRILFPDSYQMNFNTDKGNMNLIYNTFDVFLAPSRTEGFCVPIIEAQACGVPVITHNWNSMPELIIPEKTGYAVKTLTKLWQLNGAYWALPDTNDIYDKLLLLRERNRVEMGLAARKWIVANYDTKTVFRKQWKPYLEMLEEEVYGVVKEEKKDVQLKRQ